jgi:hypothetical protein
MKLSAAFISALSFLALTANAAPMRDEDGCVRVDYDELSCDEDLGGGGSGPTGIVCNNGRCATLVS